MRWVDSAKSDRRWVGNSMGRDWADQIAARTGGTPLPRRRAGYSDVASQRGAICRTNLGLKNAAKARVDA